MRSKSKIFKFIIVIPVIILLSGCVTIYNPATQKRETLLIGTKGEAALGKDMDLEIRRRLKIINNAYMQDRLERVAQKVAGRSDRQDLSYSFRIIDDKELNAFAIPGGFIYVNSALMNAANDDELACVLAHEIGHVAARHSVKKLQAALGYQIIMDIALGLGGRQEIYKAIDYTFNIVNLGYSRQDELLADKLSVKYAARAGFNPYAAVTFFEKLKEESKKHPQLNIVFLSSHPPIEERIKHIKEEIARLNAR